MKIIDFKNKVVYVGRLVSLLGLLISVSFLLIKCANEDPSPAQTFNPMIGHWIFEADSVAADFDIIDFNGTLAIDSGGTYRTPAGTDVITHKTPVLTGDVPWYIPMLKLQGNNNEMFVFTNGELNKSLTQISFRSFQYVDLGKPSAVVSGLFLVSKKKH